MVHPRSAGDGARRCGWGTVAPFYIDLEAPVPASGVPKPGAMEVHLKDDHMQYAITWFGLAGAVVIAFAGLVADTTAPVGVKREVVSGSEGKTACRDNHCRGNFRETNDSRKFT